jgi:hypothetical protein
MCLLSGFDATSVQFEWPWTPVLLLPWPRPLRSPLLAPCPGVPRGWPHVAAQRLAVSELLELPASGRQIVKIICMKIAGCLLLSAASIFRALSRAHDWGCNASEMSVNLYRTARRRDPQDGHIYVRRHEDFVLTVWVLQTASIFRRLKTEVSSVRRCSADSGRIRSCISGPLCISNSIAF